MGIMQAAHQTYETYRHLVGQINDGADPLAPIWHDIQRAQIEVVLDSNGRFINASVVDKHEPKIIIPVTAESSIRTSGDAPHSLCDQLEYIGATNVSKHAAYLDQLEKWSKSQYTHPIVDAVYAYVLSGTLLDDLETTNIIERNADGTLAKNNINTKPYVKCLVRWRILDNTNNVSIGCWENPDVFDVHIEYQTYIHRNENLGLCMISGNIEPLTTSYPKNILANKFNAKLVSANDGGGFTYRGRFATETETMSIGADATQKAHNMLRWLVANHGVRIGERTFICWSPTGKELPRLEWLDFGFPMETEPEFISQRQQLNDALAGYRNNLDPSDNAIIASLDAPTKGCASVTYFRELKASAMLDNIENWYNTCCIGMPNQSAYTPTLSRIARYAYLTRPETLTNAELGRYQHSMQELIECIVGNRQLPAPTVQSLTRRANNLRAYSDNEKKNVRARLLSTTCAILRKYRNDKGENWTLTLDEQTTDRSYLFGRLLAIAEKVERRALYETKNHHNSDPSALRLQSMFVLHPLETWHRIDQNIKPYYRKLKPQTAAYYRNLVTKIMANLDLSNASINTPLDPIYLMGYYHQRMELNTHTNNINKTMKRIEVEDDGTEE